MILSLILCVVSLGANPISHNDPVLDISEDPVYEVVDAENLYLSLKNSYQKTVSVYNGHKILISGTVASTDKTSLTLMSGKDAPVSVSADKTLISGIKDGDEICVLGSLKIGKQNSSKPITVKADLLTTQKLDMQQDYYTCIDGFYKGYSDKSSVTYKLPGGNISFRVPSAWENVKCTDEEREKLFNSEILADAECFYPGGLYGSRDLECFIIFYLDDDLLKFDSDRGSHAVIEQTAITNICPDERGFMGLRLAVNDALFNRSVKSDLGTTFYTRYVATYEDYRVEFSFVRTGSGRIAMMYIYDDDRAALSDILYVMRSISF
ncbi:MAG: hypothetical protein IJ058_06335 [Lachnospiraceae bacterium]|nr:hypothetical protein [Lachnospiraceae bacterium]